MSVVSMAASSWPVLTASPSMTGRPSSRPPILVDTRTSVASTWPEATISEGSDRRPQATRPGRTRTSATAIRFMSAPRAGMERVDVERSLLQARVESTGEAIESRGIQADDGTSLHRGKGVALREEEAHYVGGVRRKASAERLVGRETPDQRLDALLRHPLDLRLDGDKQSTERAIGWSRGKC